MKILWLKSGPLHPLDTGGKIRTYNMLRVLKRTHDLTYVSLAPPDLPEAIRKAAQEYCQHALWIPWRETRKGSVKFAAELAANFVGSPLPYVIRKYRSFGMAAALHHLDAQGLHDLIVCDFIFPAINLFPVGRRPKTPALLFQHNVESLIWRRLSEQAAGAVKQFYFRNQWRRMEKFERETCARFDAVAGVSDEDCAMMREQFGATNVLGTVPTGVDCEFFSASQWPRQAHSVVFLGSMDWMPNIDAVEFFTEEIWGQVKKQFPHASFTVVGRNPPPKIKELEKRVPGVHVTGTVDDVRPFLNQAAAMVVPLRVGGGTRIKIFEGMATGIPVISTTIGAEGLPVKSGENILLADAPGEFVAQLGLLFDQPARAAQIGMSGRALVQSKYSWKSVTRVFEEYCRETCRRHQAAPGRQPQ